MSEPLEIDDGGSSDNLTVRDHFAAKCLVRVCEFDMMPEGEACEKLARSCYRMADAMIKARKNKANALKCVKMEAGPTELKSVFLTTDDTDNTDKKEQEITKVTETAKMWARILCDGCYLTTSRERSIEQVAEVLKVLLENYK